MMYANYADGTFRKSRTQPLHMKKFRNEITIAEKWNAELLSKQSRNLYIWNGLEFGKNAIKMEKRIIQREIDAK